MLWNKTADWYPNQLLKIEIHLSISPVRLAKLDPIIQVLQVYNVAI